MPNSDKPLIAALRGMRSDRPPIWLMRQAGRYLPEYRAIRAEAADFLSLCYAPSRAAEITLQPVRRFGLDGAILFSDILVVPDALGQNVSFKEGVGPVLDPIRDEAGLSALRPEGAVARLAPVMETVAQVRASLPDGASLIGFAGAPWTVATYMVEGGSSKDYANAKGWAYRDPDGFQQLIDLLVDVTADYLLAQIDAGVEAVQLFDSWAGILPPPLFARLSIAPAREIVRRIKSAHPDIPVIGFPRGAGLGYADYAKETGIDALSLDSMVPRGWVREAIPEGCTLQGNLDSTLLRIGGAAMTREIAEILADWRDRPMVFNLGHGVLPDTPPDHVAALVAAVRGGGAG